MESNSCRICKCIDPLLVALASAEAMEHNAVVGKEVSRIGWDVKQLIGKERFEELVFEHNWLEHPITEPIAGLAFAISMTDIREKCGVPTEEVRKLFVEAVEANEKKHFGTAQGKFIQVKTEILKMATELCKKDANPGLEERITCCRDAPC